MDFRKFWLTVSVIYCLIFVSVELSDMPLGSFKGICFVSLQWCIMAVAASGIIGLISLNKYVAALGLPLLVCSSTVLAYFRITSGFTLTSAVVELWEVTGVATASDLVSGMLIFLVTLALAVSVVVVMVRFKYVRVARKTLYMIPLFLAMMSVSLVPRWSNAVYARSPFSLYSSVSGYLQMRKAASDIRHTFDDMAVRRTVCDTLNVVVVIGESLRADHLGINGYERNTTPRLSAESNLVSLRNVYSHPYFTHTSVPFMLTRATADDYEPAYEEQSFISLLRKAGFNTIWVSNQEDCSTYAYFMHEADTLVRNQPGVNLYSFTPHYDRDLLPYVDSFIAAETPLRLMIIHSIGSHWWYGCHYDENEEGMYHPVAKSKVLSDNTREEMINAYDNTILATDAFLSDLIERFRDTNTILFFQSDHGESLGENGVYLHGKDAEELHYPAAMIWYSDEYGKRNEKKAANIRSCSLKNIDTEYLFHSVIDAAGIETEALDTTRSILRSNLQAVERR